jgi:hypothetical protein
MRQHNAVEPNVVDAFDRQRGALDNLPGVFRTKPSTTVVMSPITGQAETFIVETWRQRDEADADADDKKREPSKDTIFLQHIGQTGRITKIAIPAAVADIIARQRDAVGTKVRKSAAKRLAAQRKANGEVPGFLRKRA